MFDYYQNSFFIKRTVFINDPKISLAIFKVEKTKNKKKVFPYAHTSSGKNKAVLFGKLHNEFLERFKMVYNYRTNKKTNVILLHNAKIIPIKRKVLSYGYDAIYGLKDTTGTASGLGSAALIEKAICELLEKNELMLMWYKKICRLVKITDSVNAILLQYGLSANRTKIFYVQNISNIHTVIVFILDAGNNIIGSGISGDKAVYAALISAIEEALMQKWIDELSEQSLYGKDDNKFKNYFDNLCRIEGKNIDKLKPVTEIKIKSSFNDIEIGLLNLAGFQREITIKAVSKTLMNCIPSISNIRKNKNRLIVTFFEIEKELKNAVDCAVI